MIGPDPAVTPLIVGAGVAGLALAVALGRQGLPSTVIERRPADGRVGFGFLLLPNGVKALDRIGLGGIMRDHAQRMRRLTIYDPRGRTLRDEALSADHLGLDRPFLIDRLRETAADLGARIHWRACVDAIERGDAGRVTAVRLTDGRRLPTTVLVGADGVSSRVRRALFPEARRRPLHIWELVTVAEAPEVAAVLHGRLVKYLDRPAGRAIGVLPLDRRQIIVYLQMDHRRWAVPRPDPAERRRLARSVAFHMPALARRVIEACTFTRSHFYATGDLDPLSAVHARNAVLVGDAAHPFSPFTSQGVASAIEDAVDLAHHLGPPLRRPPDAADCPDAFTRFHAERAAIWARRLNHGRALARDFLHPELHEHDAPIPFSA